MFKVRARLPLSLIALLVGAKWLFTLSEFVFGEEMDVVRGVGTLKMLDFYGLVFFAVWLLALLLLHLFIFLFVRACVAVRVPVASCNRMVLGAIEEFARCVFHLASRLLGLSMDWLFIRADDGLDYFHQGGEGEVEEGSLREGWEKLVFAFSEVKITPLDDKKIVSGVRNGPIRAGLASDEDLLLGRRSMILRIGRAGVRAEESAGQLTLVGYLPVISEEGQEDVNIKEGAVPLISAVEDAGESMAKEEDDEAETVVLTTKGLNFVSFPLRRFAARCFLLLIANSLVPFEAVPDGSQMKSSGLSEARRLEKIFHVAPVLLATACHPFVLRNQRVVPQVSFVFILLLVLIGVVGALGGINWPRFSALGLLLVADELRWWSASTKATLPARLDLVETSSCRHFDSNGPLGDGDGDSGRYADGVALEGDLERSAKSNDPILVGSVSDEPAVSSRPSMIPDWRARFLALRAQNAVLAVAEAIPPTPSAPVKLKRILQHHLPDPVELATAEEPVDMDWESAPPSPVRLDRKRRLEDSGAAVSSKRQRTLEYQIPIVEVVHETFAAACCDEQVDTGDSYTNNEPNNSSDPELASKVDGDEDDCIGASGCEESVWQLLLVGYLPVITEEDEEVVELAAEVSFSRAAEDAEELVAVAVVDEEEEEPEKVVHDAVVLSHPTRKLKTFGPWNRTRPYLNRQCKENVRYAK